MAQQRVRLETVSGIKYDLNSLIKRDLFYVKAETKDVYVFDFDNLKFIPRTFL